jgi:hypothetical protein
LISYYLALLGFALLGVVIAAFLALIPGLHVYNVIGFGFLAYLSFFPWLDDFLFAMLLVGMLTGFAVLFTITTVYLSAPDDSTMMMMMPGQKYLRPVLHGNRADSDGWLHQDHTRAHRRPLVLDDWSGLALHTYVRISKRFRSF